MDNRDEANQKLWYEAELEKNFIPIFDYYPNRDFTLGKFLNQTNTMKKIESLAEYQQLSSRTCPDLGLEQNQRHMTLGVITEIGETLDCFKKLMAYNKPLDLVNLGEELADICWYISNNSRMQGIPLDDFVIGLQDTELFVNNKMFIPNTEREQKAEALLCMLLSVYTSPPQIAERVNTIFRSPVLQISLLHIIASWYDIDFFQALTNNIAKLKVRYPEKFTSEGALNRDLGAEREKLEQSEEDYNIDIARADASARESLEE